MTIHNQVWDLGRQMNFYKMIVMHWNPCQTCRKRYWYDMEKIVKEGNPMMVEILDDGESADPIVDMWIYHNEVSQRVQAGMRRDLNVIQSQQQVSDWSNEVKNMAEKFQDDWAKDKRWPSPQMCPTCWKNDCTVRYNQTEDGGDNPINRGKFLACWNLAPVKAYLSKTYGAIGVNLNLKL